MKIQRVKVSNFRSIVDSSDVDVELKVTVLIGKNEQGKTTFLRALESFNYDYEYKNSDLPNHLRPHLDSVDDEKIEIISLVFEVDPDAAKFLKKEFKVNGDVAGLMATKYFDDHYDYAILDDEGRAKALNRAEFDLAPTVGKIGSAANNLKELFAKHGDRIPNFKGQVPITHQHIDNFVKGAFNTISDLDNAVQTMVTALKAVPHQDQVVQNDLEAFNKQAAEQLVVAKKDEQSDPFSVLHEKFVPRFVFHSNTVDKIPDSVVVEEFVKDPTASSRGMLNLCKAAGLSISKIKELTAENSKDRESYEDHYKGYISGNINEFWTQNKYEVHFRFEANRLSVSIEDGVYPNRIPPSRRSDGFQWFLSFYSTYLSEVSASRPIVLLLDNPGLELHADGQRDIKRFLEDRLPGEKQIVYVTQAPQGREGKITGRYRDHFRNEFGVGFDKKRAAHKLKELLVDKEVDGATENNLKLVAEKLSSVIKAIVGDAGAVKGILPKKVDIQSSKNAH